MLPLVWFLFILKDLKAYDKLRTSLLCPTLQYNNVSERIANKLKPAENILFACNHAVTILGWALTYKTLAVPYLGLKKVKKQKQKDWYNCKHNKPPGNWIYKYIDYLK